MSLTLYYETDFVDVYENGLGEVTFKDLRTNKKVIRDYYFVEVTPSYCDNVNNVNESIGKKCYPNSWKKLDTNNIPKGKNTIGIITEIREYDYLDIIFTFAGKKLSKHAPVEEGDFISKFDLSVETSSAAGVDINSSTISISDSVDAEVYFYNLSGTYFNQSFDTAAGGNAAPSGITSNSTTFLTIDDPDNKIYAWGRDGSAKWNCALNASNSNVVGIAMNTTTILTVDRVDDKVYGYDYGCTSLWDWDLNASQAEPRGIAMFGENIRVVDLTADEVFKYNLDGTHGGASWDTAGAGADLPVGMSFGGNDGEFIRIVDATDVELYKFQGLVVISITLNSPVDAFKTTNQTIDFNGTVTSPNGITNVTLFIDGILNETNSSGLNTTDYIFTRTFLDGDYNWTYESCNADGCSTANTRTFTVDTIAPVINVIFPNETIIFHKKDTNLNLNWTVSDATSGLSSCWFDWNNVNTTLTCGDNNSTINITDGLVKNLTFYANDTVNNLGSETVSWDYRLFLNSETFDSEIIEGTETTFSANFFTNGSAIDLVVLRYNNTDNNGSIAIPTSNNFTVSKTITSPIVGSKTNISFFWNISQGPVSHSLDLQNQTVLNLGIDDCSVNSNVIYNFSIIDEENLVVLNATRSNTLGKINFQLFSPTSVLITEYSNNFTQINPFSICLSTNLNQTDKDFIHDVEIQYGADDFQSEIYNIQNATLNSSLLGVNISLLDLNSSDAQVFKIIFRNSAFLPIENALIEISRKYIDKGVFNITEIPKTDERGETVASFVINEIIYKINVIKFGQTLLSVNNVIATCQIPLIEECIIDLNAFSETIDLPDFETVDNFNFTIGYDNDTRIISSTFLILNDVTSTISLNVTRQDALGTAVCTDIITSSSGTLSCTVPSSFGNSTITAKLFVNGELKGTGSIKQDQNPSDIYGATLIGLSIFIMLSLIGTAISSNPVFTTVFLMLGVVMLFTLNFVANNGFIGSGATILFLVIAMILLLVKGARRN